MCWPLIWATGDAVPLVRRDELCITEIKEIKEIEESNRQTLGTWAETFSRKFEKSPPLFSRKESFVKNDPQWLSSSRGSRDGRRRTRPGGISVVFFVLAFAIAGQLKHYRHDCAAEGTLDSLSGRARTG